MIIKDFFPLRSLVLMTFLALAILPVRGDDTNYIGSDWDLINVTNVLAAAKEITPEKYPNSDSVTVDQKSMRVYQPDGTGGNQDETFTKVLTEKGRRDNRTLSLGYQLPYFTVSVPVLEVIQPDGKVIPVDVAANSKESIDDSQMAENIYDPNSLVLRVNIPGLETGDIVHSVVRQKTVRPLITGEFDDENIFEGTGHIRHINYEIHAPGNRPLLRIGLRDEVPGTVSYSTQTNADGSLIYHWDINNVPRMYDEASMPPYDEVLQRLFVSTTPDWQTISKWYWNLSQSHLAATTPEMKAKVAELIAGKTSDMEKIHALFYYVSKVIRYMGLTPEKDRPGFEPHDVCITFDKKYGVCRDKAALLVAMLRIAGFDAYPVLINIGAKRDQEVPQPDFDHAIVSVELKKGEYVLMDPTDENTPDLLPAYDCNRSFLVCRAEGENLLTSPVPPVDQHLMTIATTGVLDANGHLEAKSKLVFNGVNDDEYRNAFSHMKQDDEHRFFERALKSALPGAKLKTLKLLPENMLDISTKLHAELEFSVDGLTVIGGSNAVVSLPWIGRNFGIVNFLLRDSAGLEKRKYPLETEVTCGMQENISLKLANGFAGPISMPSDSSVDDDSLSYSQNIAFNNGSLDAAREFKLKTVEFLPAQYSLLKQTLKSMEYDARKNSILAVTADFNRTTPVAENSAAAPVQSNAEILWSHKKLEVADAHTAVYTVNYSKRILTYDGKINESDVKIDYNPASSTAKLISAVVISKTGERKEISNSEINVMDQGWNPSARRYTGGKILVANLPGVEIGSTIEAAYSITFTNQLYLADYEPFQLVDALDQKTFDLIAAPDVIVRKMTGGAAGIITETNSVNDGRRVFQWSAENVKALPAESQLPPAWDYTAGVGYFIGNENDYLKTLNAAMLTHSRNSTNAAATAQRLTAHAANKLEAIKSIRDFIAKSIRLAGPSFTDLPLNELSDADTTLSDGYGHLADRAILFHAMLAAAGFHPEFVLASDLPPIAGITNITDSFPLPQYFQTPLVRITVDGETYYLNDTDEYSQLGTTPADGNLGIALTTGTIETLHAATNGNTRADVAYAVSLTDAGKARITVTRNYYGTDYNAKNRYFSELPPEERNRYYQKIVSGMAQGARPVGDLTTKFDSYPGLESYTVDIDNYAVVDGKYFYFDLPAAPTLFAPGVDHRTLPYYISQKFDGIVRTAITLPPQFQQVVIEPESELLTVPGGTSMDIMRMDGNGQSVFTDRLAITPSIIDPQDYPVLLKVESTLGKKSAKLFLLEQK